MSGILEAWLNFFFCNRAPLALLLRMSDACSRSFKKKWGMQSGKNRSNHVFKKFFRSHRVSPTNDRAPQLTGSRIFQNIETGEPGTRQGRCGPLNLFIVWDNPISMKLLGSKSAIEKEEMRRRSLPYFIIHPCCRFRWSLTTVQSASAWNNCLALFFI